MWHVVEPNKAWKLSSRQVATGANLSVIGGSLNYESTQTTAIDARLWMTPVRESMQTAATATLAAAGLNSKSPEDNEISSCE
ncbi:hypothetical protein [Paraburkholderia sp. BCC1884]|uniref:hypothetical protein n=1 Tax=Paraburkholderia sp. BCC1884 TaxID=2562668 RepID=UPI0016433F7F|nr:hypothetical protein [Paraburkholderia sp. BCC1884]